LSIAAVPSAFRVSVEAFSEIPYRSPALRGARPGGYPMNEKVRTLRGALTKCFASRLLAFSDCLCRSSNSHTLPQLLL
jgi:hypothetical protein